MSFVGRSVLSELDARQTSRAERDDAVHVFEVRAREHRVPDALEGLPVLQVCVEAGGADERGAGLRSLGKARREVEERVACFSPVLHALEREPEIERVLGRPRSVGRGRHQEAVGLCGVRPPLFHEGPFAARRELGLGRHLGRGHDAGRCVDVGRRYGRRGRLGRRARGQQPHQRDPHDSRNVLHLLVE